MLPIGWDKIVAVLMPEIVIFTQHTRRAEDGVIRDPQPEVVVVVPIES